MPDATSVCSVSMAATQARRRRYLLAALAAAVTGCKLEELPPTPPPASPPEERTGGLALTGLNYTDVPIGVFYINGKWGGNVFTLCSWIWLYRRCELALPLAPRHEVAPQNGSS